jgi:hypothetical protein
MRKKRFAKASLAKLLRKHRLHDGVFVRVAKSLGVDPSHVSKVASGKIISLGISRALLKSYSESSACDQKQALLCRQEAAPRVTRKRLHNLPD